MKNKARWKPGGRDRTPAGAPMINRSKNRKRKETRERTAKEVKAA